MTNSSAAARPSPVRASVLWLLFITVTLCVPALSVSAQGPDSDNTEQVHGRRPDLETREQHLHEYDARQDPHADGLHADLAEHLPEGQGAISARHEADEDEPDDHHREHDEHGHAEDQPAEVRLTAEQLLALDIATESLEPRSLGVNLSAPGEVRLNSYATARVTPRIEAQVVARHSRLGDRVEKGQPLVTLSSVEMAVAQGDLVVAEREWQRLTKLGDRFVSDSSYVEASVARQKARSRAFAFGMTQMQIDQLVQSDFQNADGTFELLAPQSGTLIRDAFVLGELVEPGRVLFEITDERVRWVEAQMPPEEAALVSSGDLARVGYRGSWLEGRVTQIHHLLDVTTRTQAVRIEVPDPEHRLHPGVFVDAVILAGEGEAVLAVPEAAVLRGLDGDWLLFVAAGEDGAYRRREVDVLRTTGGLAVIEGPAAGTQVVTRGAFFLQSELAKSGFDPHNH